MVMFLLGICLLVIYGLNLMQYNYAKNNQNKSQSDKKTQVITFIIATLVSICIIWINCFLIIFIKQSTNYELRATQTGLQIGIGQKLAIA